MTCAYRKLLIVGVMVVLVFSGAGVMPAKAAPDIVFNVDSFADDNDFAINSVCSVGAITGGPCTLRAAIAEANGNVQYSNIIINLPAGTYNLSLPPLATNDIQSGDLNISDSTGVNSISVVGTDTQPAVIDANQLDRVFDISENARVNMTNLVVRNGLLSWTGTADKLDGAGILNNGTLFLDRVTVENNEARCGQATCNFNIAGGGIANMSLMTITDSTIRNNKSEGGSAIFNSGETGNMVIKNSTISGNFANVSFTIVNYSRLQIRNCTLSNNSTAAANLAGIGNRNILFVESSTFANSGTYASIFNDTLSQVTIQDSILLSTSPSAYGNCYSLGTWISNGYNVYSDFTCPASGTGDLSNTNPLLGTLGYWGGSTMTMPLQTGSPAKNHRPGNCTTIPEGGAIPSMTLTIDQRHYARSDGSCDSGAFEGTLDVSNFFLPIIFR